jgi:predicted nucleotidyltransferase
MLLDQALERIVAFLSARPDVQTIILIGSYAAGQRDLFTDLDILVVMDSPLDYLARTDQLRAALQTGVDVDLLVYTPEEFEQLRDKPFLNQALKGSKVLYEKKQPG